MKNFMTCMLLLCSSASFAANSLLKYPVSGLMPGQTTVNSIDIISNGTDAAMVLGNTGFLTVVDIADSKTSESWQNTISSISGFVAAKLDASAGRKVTVIDMAVNPRSKAVYILARNTGSTTGAVHVFRVSNGGNTVTKLNLSNATYSQLNISANYKVNSVAWGDNTLFVSAGSGSLNAELDYMNPPFENNTAFKKRLTSMFKSNWGGQYFTDAPLEKMAYGEVNGVKRLAGVTTCAPGFSLDISKLGSTGTLQVTEDFNVHNGSPSKVMLLQHDSKSWLYDLHEPYPGAGGTLYRIGEKYLDGSQPSGTKFNRLSQKLRTNAGAIASGMTNADIVSLGKIAAVARWDDGRLLILDPETSGGALRLVTVGNTPIPAGVAGVSIQPLGLAPNPARQSVMLRLPDGMQSGMAVITAMDGKVLRQEQLRQSSSTIQLGGLPAGTYAVQVTDGSQLAAATLQVQ
jgi:hypothetical protein